MRRPASTTTHVERGTRHASPCDRTDKTSVGATHASPRINNNACGERGEACPAPTKGRCSPPPPTNNREGGEGGGPALAPTKVRCSPRAQQPDRFVALEDVKEMAQCLAA